ncbi:TonB-dependent receptor [Dechloromonas denitrificans]|uniref:TonB-dependent receptor n=1 Tax=Dechloromonas denitrificans TaxID=281362 RepID=UPI001CFBEA2B|nr:TonB-dependent receptor [Dechloromonas denitrificans]UCV09553.1 TonB-dependent receptor [Dechloromonas denitrificans]
MYNPHPAAAADPGIRGAIKPVVFAIHLALAVIGSAPALAQSSGVAATYNIPAGPLGEALNRFALQAGVAIAVDAEKLRDLRTDGLHGRYEVEAGFSALLRNTGYGISKTAAGYMLVAHPKAAPTSRKEEAGDPILGETLVVDQRESAGTTVVDRHVIDSLSAGNGDITSILRVMPNVQFDNNQLHTGRQGEISPADISINGAKFYQNLYQLDGMSFNNDIDPASGDKSSSITEVSSASQGFAIDSSLLCKITVRDSNVPVEYGAFTGGVVSADTCAPTRTFAGQASIGTTRSTWMEYKIAPEQQSDYDNTTSSDYARKFEKWTYKLSLQGKPTENLGLIGSFIRRTSTIPLNGDSGYKNGGGSTPEETRQTDNFFIKAFWKPTVDHDVDFSIQYAPTADKRFLASIKDSQFNYTAGGLGINTGIVSRFDSFVLSQRLTSTEMESSRDGDSSIYKTWRYSAADKNWGTTTLSLEGGYGDVEQKQSVQAYLAKVDWEPVSLLSMAHRFQAGFELSQKESSYHRKTQYESYYTPATYSGNCIRADGTVDPYCSTADTSNGWAGQYLKSRVVYLAGKFTVKDDTRSIFLQDEIKKGNFTARVGARYEDSALTPESTLAPRSAFFYDLFGDGSTRLEAGANRYYGRNFMAYYMQANRLSLQSATTGSGFTRSSLTDWGPLVMSTTAAGYHFEDLKVPYDDEGMLAIKQRWGGATWGLKYVDRTSRDQVVQVLRSINNRWFENTGTGEAQTLSMTIETQRPIKLWGTMTSIMAGAEKIKSRTSHADYYTSDQDYNDNRGLDYVVYNGSLISAGAKPADNYNRPWTGRVLLMTEIPRANLSIGNFFRYRAGYQKTVQNGTQDVGGVSYTNYDRRSFKPAFTWDMRINWDVPTPTEQKPYVSLTIDNILNATNAIENSGTYLVYEKGRQFWLELGIKF